MAELVARYALSRRQIVEADALPKEMLAELMNHERLGRRIVYSEDHVREVLLYHVYEGEPDQPERTYIPPGDVQLFVQLQASLLSMGVTSTSDDIRAIREAGLVPLVPLKQ